MHSFNSVIFILHVGHNLFEYMFKNGVKNGSIIQAVMMQNLSDEPNCLRLVHNCPASCQIVLPGTVSSLFKNQLFVLVI